jgi:hypothetical protein
MSEHASVPTRDDVAQKIRQLIAGELSREAVANWAAPWIGKFHEIELDRKIKDALDSLAAADMPTSDRPYLFEQVDFEAWLDELMA